ncbi:ThiF family adenylyltransferase [Clostridium sp.]|uniref:ThiF family adenylyltransferase n=1 Tax=Clostridium sp. TaxID=1506 RepID=UPI003993CD07
MKYSIFLIGTGATGSNLIGNLAQYAIGEKKIKNIILIDGDLVESKNYRNQKFTAKDLGKNKAKVLANRYSKLDIDISYVDSYIKDKESLIDIIKNYKTAPIIISCIDNNNGRIILDQVFRSDAIPSIVYIDTGNGDETSRLGQTIIGAKQDHKIIAPPVGDYFPQIFEGDKDIETIKTYSCSTQIVEKPQCLTSNVLSATTVFLILVNLISYNKVEGRYFKFNAEHIGIEKIR